jgi:hypothetical protein
MPRVIRIDIDWLAIPGKTLLEIETAAIRSSFVRHNGNRTKMRHELQMSRTNLLVKLDRLGLRKTRVPRRCLKEPAIARAFWRHCQTITAELNIQDTTLLKWINRHAPFAIEEG